VKAAGPEVLKMRAPVALSPSGCFFAVRRRSLMVIYLSPTKNTTYVFGKTPLYALGARRIQQVV
jgi:hypothetical protein